MIFEGIAKITANLIGDVLFTKRKGNMTNEHNKLARGRVIKRTDVFKILSQNQLVRIRNADI